MFWVEPISPAERELWEQDADVIVRRAKLANYRQELRDLRDGPITREKEVERKRLEFIARLEARARGKKLEVDPVKPEERELWENDPKVLELRAEIARKYPPKPEPTLEDKQARYKERLLQRIGEIMAGTTKEKKKSKWELTPEQRKQVERDPAVQAAARELARVMQEQRKDGWLTYLLALRSAGLLSGPGTHIRNTASNAAFQIFNEASRPMAMMADFALRNLSGKAVKERTVQGISASAIREASRNGAVKGWQDAKEIMKTGEVRNGDTKIFDFTRELNARHLFESKPVLKHLAWTNDAINLVFRTLKAEDRFFKQAAYERSIQEQMSLAKTKVPTEEMMLQAWADADFMTFNNQNVAAKTLNRGIAELEKSGLGGKFLAAGVKFFLPFRNTPANVWMRGFEGMGGGVITGLVKTLANEGQLTAAQQRAISMEIGRGSTGLALVALGFMGAQQGWISGMHGQDERGERAVGKAAGIPDGAVRFGKKWVSVLGLSPLSNILLVGATMARKYEDLGAFFSNPDEALALFSSTVKDQPMLRGVQDILEAVENRKGQSAGIFGSAAGSIVPSALNAVGQATDDKQRDTRGGNVVERMGKSMMARTPGLRQMLPEKLDVMGRSIPQDRLAGLGFPADTETDNPALLEMVRVGVSMDYGKERQGEDKKKYELRMAAAKKRGDATPERLPNEAREVYAARQAAIGDGVLRRVDKLMGTPRYQQADKVEQQQLIEKVIAQTRTRAGVLAKTKTWAATPVAEKREWLAGRIAR